MAKKIKNKLRNIKSVKKPKKIAIPVKANTKKIAKSKKAKKIQPSLPKKKIKVSKVSLSKKNTQKVSNKIKKNTKSVILKVSKKVKNPQKTIVKTNLIKEKVVAQPTLKKNPPEKVKIQVAKTELAKSVASPVLSKKQKVLPVKKISVITMPVITKDKPLTSKKDPKGKFVIEYVVHSSSNILYEFLTTPSGLSEWFADDVNIRDGIYTFFWDGSQQQAKLLGCKEPQFIRFKWMDRADETYFEFRIQIDDLTGDVALIVSDFAENEAEIRTSKLLWNSQVNKLLHVLGSY